MVAEKPKKEEPMPAGGPDLGGMGGLGGMMEVPCSSLLGLQKGAVARSRPLSPVRLGADQLGYARCSGSVTSVSSDNHRGAALRA